MTSFPHVDAAYDATPGRGGITPFSRLHILYFSSFGNLRWGGQKSLYHLIDGLDRRRFRPFAVVPEEGELAWALRQKDVTVYIVDLPSLKGWSLLLKIRALRRLARIVRENRIVLMHADGPRNAAYAGLVGKFYGIPIVFHVRSSDADRYDRLLHILSTRLILVADALRQRFAFAKKGRKLVVIHNGLDLNDFTHRDVARIIRPAFGIDEDAALITCTGRIEPMKGQLTLIEACGGLQAGVRRWQLFFAGDITDTGYLEQCRKAAARYGIEHAATFAGNVEDIPQLLAETDVFVLPSFGEAFSRAIIEAMAMQKAIIATDVGGAAEAIVDGISGFIVPPHDPERLRERIAACLADAELRERLGREARKRVEALFTLERNVRETQRLYEEILGDL